MVTYDGKNRLNRALIAQQFKSCHMTYEILLRDWSYWNTAGAKVEYDAVIGLGRTRYSRQIGLGTAAYDA